MTTAVEDIDVETTEPEPAHQMSIMNGNGDTKLIWDIDNEDEVAAAEAMFEELVKVKKFLAYTVDNKGEQAEVVREFDPEAAAYILAPQTVGG